jgi:hypothetical protein
MGVVEMRGDRRLLDEDRGKQGDLEMEEARAWVHA